MKLLNLKLCALLLMSLPSCGVGNGFFGKMIQGNSDSKNDQLPSSETPQDLTHDDVATCLPEQGDLSVFIEMLLIDKRSVKTPLDGWRISRAIMINPWVDDYKHKAFLNWIWQPGSGPITQRVQNKPTNVAITNRNGKAVLCFKVDPKPDLAEITLYDGRISYEEYKNLEPSSTPAPVFTIELEKDGINTFLTGFQVALADKPGSMRILGWLPPCALDPDNSVRHGSSCSVERQDVLKARDSQAHPL